MNLLVPQLSRSASPGVIPLFAAGQELSSWRLEWFRFVLVSDFILLSALETSSKEKPDKFPEEQDCSERRRQATTRCLYHGLDLH
jgi:hypothetical protein